MIEPLGLAGGSSTVTEGLNYEHPGDRLVLNLQLIADLEEVVGFHGLPVDPDFSRGTQLGRQGSTLGETGVEEPDVDADAL